jgi:hypothetical protein
MWDITVDGAHSFFVGSGAVLVHNADCGGGKLYRYGTEAESAGALAEQSRAAAAQGFPHGVSVRSRIRPDRLPLASVASRSAVEKVFPVMKTGRDPFHFTVVLPDEVTPEAADAFNALFGRR